MCPRDAWLSFSGLGHEAKAAGDSKRVFVVTRAGERYWTFETVDPAGRKGNRKSREKVEHGQGHVRKGEGERCCLIQ